MVDFSGSPLWIITENRNKGYFFNSWMDNLQSWYQISLACRTMAPKIWTSLLFIIPAIVSFCLHLYLYFGVITLAMLSSVAYHKMKERKFYWLDLVASFILMGFNLAFLLKAKLDLNFWLIPIGFVILSFYFWNKAHKKQYGFNHSLWHIFSMMITTYSVLAYQISSSDLNINIQE